ncbi:MAG: hypothetical protein LKI25_03225 [Atopobiaceae bacterium]|jgi:aminomethyltransferase|nr:hypothetical protein [Atopobiaceae bacterium]MCI2173217.1 hypothetical protein [Atopobiaceae bacterium]MCI2207212.1 hypothetical protein [Atopobiaceae bacterium]
MTKDVDGQRPLVGCLLYDEHALLGATFVADPYGVLVPDFYGDGNGEPEAFDSGCALTDVSGMRTLLVSGVSASEFVPIVATCEALQVGEVSWSLVLAGDGGIVACVLLARTGDDEYVFWCPQERASALDEWLTALAEAEQDGVRPFKGLSVADVTGRLETLLLAGPSSEEVLSDYLSDGESIPIPGHIEQLLLDSTECLAGSVTLGPDVLTLVLVPTPKARVFWRSLLSFEQVVPVGLSALWARIGSSMPGALELADEPDTHPKPAEAGLESLMRGNHDFVGARGLVKA